MPDYSNDAYLQSLDQSSADIRRQVQNSIGEINRQREVAGQQAAKIPAAANNIYGGGSQSMSDDIASISRTGKHGEQAVTPLASMLDAFTNGAASYGRASGLLDQGFEEQAVQRRAGAESILQQLIADQASKAALYRGGLESEDRGMAFQREEADRRAAIEREAQDRDAALRKELLDLERSNTNYLPPALNYGLPSVLPPTRRPTPESRGIL